MTQPAARPSVRDPQAVRTALRFFKFTSIAAGLALFVLVAELILHHVLHNEALAWWSPVHGLIFMVFAISVFNLGLKLRWGVGRMVLILLASCLPFAAFVVERKVADEVEPRLAGSLGSRE